AVNLWNYNRLSAPEREALNRYRALLVREPFTEDAPEVARAIHRLGTKQAQALCDSNVDAGKKALDADDLDHATFYLQAAGRQEGCQDAAARPLAKLDTARARRAAREDAGRWPVDDAPGPETTSESEDLDALAVATAVGDPGIMVQAARRFEERHD